MKWLDGIKAAIPGLLASPGANTGDSQVVIEDAPSSVRQVAIIGKNHLLSWPFGVTFLSYLLLSVGPWDLGHDGCTLSVLDAVSLLPSVRLSVLLT